MMGVKRYKLPGALLFGPCCNFTLIVAVLLLQYPTAGKISSFYYIFLNIAANFENKNTIQIKKNFLKKQNLDIQNMHKRPLIL